MSALFRNTVLLLLLSLLTWMCRKAETPAETASTRLAAGEVPETREALHAEFSDPVKMQKVSEGRYTPLFGDRDSLVSVEAFMMDEVPVTNRQFLAFTKRYPTWRRSHVKRIFADGNYLIHWENDTTLASAENPEAPVTNISWFAARAYCKCLGKDLPTVSEWEYAGNAGKTAMDARKDAGYNQYILDWYERPRAYAHPVRSTYQNYWGVWDLHGLVWEWTLDFNEVMLSGESRRDVSNDNSLFCGSGSVGANELMNYAAFMRYAFRGSLHADYAIRNLGFRCVKKIPEK